MERCVPSHLSSVLIMPTPRRDGQVELTLVAGYVVARWYVDRNQRAATKSRRHRHSQEPYHTAQSNPCTTGFSPFLITVSEKLKRYLLLFYAAVGDLLALPSQCVYFLNDVS